MVSDALNNYMLENKHTTATVVPAFNRVQLRPPRNRYIISISWVPKWKIKLKLLTGCREKEREELFCLSYFTSCV